ncbi:AMP-binding protein [Telmatospirillum sp.]|uniref:AMP-binding protein n=1 Tax=Telmatospirillum sp. TaxID=2079197 RepID=UPI00283C799D|nr:AMP-binding protein [Telmatospirillum sp.]MDR3440517.1 AMP-binding protein [Telmatospirillum sp.]
MTTFAEARAFLLANRSDYAAATAGFQWPDPVPFNWAIDWFDARLGHDAEYRDRPALWIVETTTGSETRLSFQELSHRSNRVANFLRDRGLKRGDHLLLLLGNVVPLWETMLAAMKLGAVVIPATTLLTSDELHDRIERGRAKFVVAGADQVAKFENIAPHGMTRISVGATDDTPGWMRYEDADACSDRFQPDAATGPDDPMLLYFTSGTTAKPKLVRHSHRSYPIGSLSTMYWLGLQPGDVHLNISSPGWAKHAWSSLFAPWNAGAAVFVVNQPRFDAKALLEVLERCPVTTLCAPPTVWRHLIQEDLGARKVSLREVCGAGEPLNPEVIERVRSAWGLTIRDGYGQTETTAQVANSPGQTVKIGSMGRQLPGYQIRVLDVDGNEAQEGEVCLVLGAARPAGLMQGYQDAEGGLTGVDGNVYRTGDVAFLDQDGYLTFVGRADDVFKSSDYRISPFELESVLIEHPAVAEAAVVPSPDPLRLTVPKAYVSLVAEVPPSRETALSIFRFAQERLAPFKRIRIIAFMPNLPKTISGKIRRAQLRRLDYEGGEDAGIQFTEAEILGTPAA